MEIKISFTKDEVREIIKKHALKEFPINTETHNTEIRENYGNFSIEIYPKTEAEGEQA